MAAIPGKDALRARHVVGDKGNMLAKLSGELRGNNFDQFLRVCVPEGDPSRDTHDGTAAQLLSNVPYCF
jgi:hypothetical protein